MSSMHSGREILSTARCTDCARQMRSSLIVLKEFPDSYRESLNCFATNGYARVPSMPMVRLNIAYANFEEYMTQALSKVTRKSLRRKFKSAAEADPITMSVVEDITPFVDEVYPLYLQVYERSTLHFEKLTREFLCRLGRRDAGPNAFFHLAAEWSSDRLQPLHASRRQHLR